MDLDADGHLDILSGSWPGELFLFRGGPKRTFASPIMLKDKRGRYINIGGGVQIQGDGSILITGHGTFEKDEDGHYVLYQGKKIRSTAGTPVALTGTASAVHAADWNGDGVLDLLVGDIGGNVYLIPNEGTPKKYAFGKHRNLKADGKAIRIAGGDAGPFVADWDGDGKSDLLVGAGDGSVWFFRNVGSTRQPKLAGGKQLVAPGSVTYGADAPRKPTRGVRAKVCVADWNGDGRLDLLVGDYATQKPDLPKPTPAEKAKHKKIRAELNKMKARFRVLIRKMRGPSRVRDKNEYEKVTNELKKVSQTMQKLRGKLPPEYEDHGWVWLFLRRPKEKK